jgi:hypothetical protein
MNVHHSIFEFHLLRIAKFAHGQSAVASAKAEVRLLIAAFNDGIYSVQSKCREIKFTMQGGNHSTLKATHDTVNYRTPWSVITFVNQKSIPTFSESHPHSKLEVSAAADSMFKALKVAVYGRLI